MCTIEFDRKSKKDKPVAEIQGGDDDGLVLYLNTGDPCCSECSPKCGMRGGRRCCRDCMGGCCGSGCLECGGGGCEECSGGRKMKGYKIRSGTMWPIPEVDPEKPGHGFIFGCSGSGKSYFVKEYATLYQNIYPRNKVFLISYVDDHSAIDEIRDLIRIPLEDVEKLTAEGLSNSLVIFDDVDSKPPSDERYDSKKLFTDVETLRDQLLTTGRHFGVSVYVTSHQGANFNHTKVPINESSFVVVFPKGGNHAHIERVLRTYGGLTLPQLKKIYELPARWVYIHKAYPNYVVYEKGMYLL